MQNIYEHVGKKIREERKKRHLTQATLAEIANMSPNFLGQIERGTKKASLETIRKIANALKTPVSNMFGEISEVHTVKERKETDSYIFAAKLASVLNSKSFLQDLRKIILKQIK